MSRVEIPALGESVAEAEVVNILVEKGERVAADQPLVELEADKASVEVPAPRAGTVTEILVARGDVVTPGAAIVELQEDGVSEANGEPRREAPRELEPEPEPEAEAAAEERPAREAAPPPPPAPEPRPAAEARRQVSASPATRRFARELAVDLDVAADTLGVEVLSVDDIKRYVRELPRPGRATRREPLGAVERAAARRLARSWPEIPQVTHHDLADVTELERARREVRERRPELPLTITALAVKAAIAAFDDEPRLNGTFEGDAVVCHGSADVGVAVDTERGLVVPVVRGASAMTCAELAVAIASVARAARAGALAPGATSGATFTVTNLGGIGGVHFSPLVNRPGVAILGISRLREEARRGAGGDLVWRDLLPLSLSYDHRAVDGATAARFVNRLVALLESPLELLLSV